MQHFLDIKHLSHHDISALLELVQQFKKHAVIPKGADHTVAQLFYENSTRTRISFEMAAKNLGMRVINVNLQTSSERKGEELEDTVINLRAMGIRYFVIRHPQALLPHTLAETLASHDVHIINAGDGTHAHPSQAMLDLMTMCEHRSQLDASKIVLVGDLRHSRVANSMQEALFKVGVGALVMVAPPIWQPEKLHSGEVTDNITEALRDADVVVGLRVQRERLSKRETLDLATYSADFAITPERMRLAKPDAIVMHPGPVNRGIEMDSDVVDGPQSKIFAQVENGVWMRMAILATLMHHQ